jgi:uncharacterized membrane protein YeaQ/YmgE (transglycosylase-associated protein family)
MIGLVAGWLAGKIVTGRGFGISANMLVGIVGAFFGAWLFHQLGVNIGVGFLSAIISATAGAVVLLEAIKLAKSPFGKFESLIR